MTEELTQQTAPPPTDHGELTPPPSDTDPQDLPPPNFQVYEVTVPEGVLPDQQFTVMATNHRVLLKCPPHAVPGQKIRFQLPVRPASTNSPKAININIRLSYNGKEGLRRISLF